jgi:hypothetical protein
MECYHGISDTDSNTDRLSGGNANADNYAVANNYSVADDQPAAINYPGADSYTYAGSCDADSCADAARLHS